MDALVQLIKVILLLPCLAAWAVIGLLLWVPMLVRSVAIFSVAAAASAVSHKAPSDALEESLNRTIRVYPRGFLALIQTFFGSEVSVDSSSESKEEMGFVGYLRASAELIWALIFWCLTAGIYTGLLGKVILYLLGDKAALN